MTSRDWRGPAGGQEGESLRTIGLGAGGTAGEDGGHQSEVDKLFQHLLPPGHSSTSSSPAPPPPPQSADRTGQPACTSQQMSLLDLLHSSFAPKPVIGTSDHERAGPDTDHARSSLTLPHPIPFLPPSSPLSQQQRAGERRPEIDHSSSSSSDHRSIDLVKFFNPYVFFGPGPFP